MNDRVWINEALHLRFDKKVVSKQISKRVNIPRTTLQSLFRRFTRSGLSWPLPAHISSMRLEQLLYPGKSPKYDAAPPQKRQEKRRRPNFTPEFKRHLVKLSMQPDANVARLAREHGINDNLLFNWRHQHKQGKLLCADNPSAELLPVSIVSPFVPSAPLTTSLSDDKLHCEVTLPGGTVKLCGAVTPALLRVLLSELKGGVR